MDKNEKRFRRVNQAAPGPLRETEYHAPVRYPADGADRRRIRRTWLAIGLPVLCVIALLTWYFWPVHRTERFTACTVEGETARAELDVTVGWRLLRPRKDEVVILWNGVRYSNVGNTDSDWLRAFSYLGENLKSRWVFLTTGDLGLAEAVWDEEMWKAWAGGSGPAPDVLWVYSGPAGYQIIPPGEGPVDSYYAPASTAQEARALEQRWLLH